MNHKAHIPELLAPAGNRECLHAAVRAGADAVYLGLNSFNARRNADNFTIETLREACDYAHLRGVAIYVTLNIAILPSELDEALACARDAVDAGADALIVQDIGLAAEIARTIPDAEVHVSTQMNIHNAAGIEAAARLGATRVTLARELSLAEISELADLAAQFNMEVECFAHGALCICYSGQCLMSSLIGGRSANRGLCAQACRLPYELHRGGSDKALPADGEHLLSPRDLCTIDILDDLCCTGAASLKLEGRMKSAEYVYEVTSVYREALDALATANGSEWRTAETRERWRMRLAEAFSRGFTTAYLTGERGNAMMSYGRPNNRGVFVGRVARIEDGLAEISPEVELHENDVIEFWTNRGHFTATVPPLSTRAGSRGNKPDSTVRIPVSQKTGKGDRVFRVRNARTAFVDDELEPRVPVWGHAELIIGQRAHLYFTSAAGAQGEAWGDIVEPARTKPLEEEDVRKHIDRLGQTPFALFNLDITMSAQAGMGFSQLHRLRAEALENLQQEMLAPYRRARSGQLGSSPAIDHGRKRGKSAEEEQAAETPRDACGFVTAWATNPGNARAAKRAGASAIFVPLLNFRRGQSQICGVRQDEAEQAGYPKQCLMALPTVDHDPSAGTREELLSFDPWDYVRAGKTVFADSLAGAVRAIDAGASVELGPHVPVTNEASLRLAYDLGIKRVWLSPELTLGQIADLASVSPVELGVFVSGAQELMICEHCLLMSQGPCTQQCETCPRRSVEHTLVDRKGFSFPVITDALGRSHLYNGIELDAVSALPDFMDMGISAFMVDTTFMNKNTAEAAIRRIIRAVELAKEQHRKLARRPGTTTGHLFRGVS